MADRPVRQPDAPDYRDMLTPNNREWLPGIMIFFFAKQTHTMDQVPTEWELSGEGACVNLVLWTESCGDCARVTASTYTI